MVEYCIIILESTFTGARHYSSTELHNRIKIIETASDVARAADRMNGDSAPKKIALITGITGQVSVHV